MGWAMLIAVLGAGVFIYAITTPGTQLAESIIGGALVGTGLSAMWRLRDE